MLEIVIATAIIATSFLAVLSVAQKSILLSRQAMHESQAAFLLEEGAEAVQTMRDSAWTNISSLTLGTNYYPLFSGGVWTLSTSPNQVGNFTRKVVIASVYRNNTSADIASSGTLDSGTKKVTVTVSWPEGSKTISKTLSFYLLNLFYIIYVFK